MLLLACLILSGAHVMAQPVQDSLMSKQERARELERQIGRLEARLALAKQDSVSIAMKLDEIEKSMLDCYMEIDRAEAEVNQARDGLNNSLRAMYVRGRQDTVVQLVSMKDVSDFLAWYQNMISVTSYEASTFKALKEKRGHLRDVQERLASFRKEQARLTRTADTTAITSEMEQKKSELADINSTLISKQLPTTYSPPPAVFSPGKVFARPDENAFTPTGQIFSGYSSWYGVGLDGNSTASGEVFNEYAYTCAHRTLPFGTWLKVTFRGRSVIVKVNDRGPFVSDRVVDLCKASADSIGLTGAQWVDYEIVVPRR
jgi:rare lipoprotein A (peptidoglycan hydrolase)